MKNVSRWLFIGVLVVVLPAKLLFVDLWRWILMTVNQPDLALGVPQLLALMVAEVSFVVALIGGSIFVGVRVLRSGSVARATVLYLIMAMLGYHLARPLLFDMSRRLPNLLVPDIYSLHLEIWVAAAAWTYGAVVTWCSLAMRPGRG
jgi:hypothetical protein